MVISLVDGSEKILPFSRLSAYITQMKWEFMRSPVLRHEVLEICIRGTKRGNTEGGIFPAIFGTVMMVLIMSIAVVPLGVITAIYLREYTRDNIIARLVRISVNNLAGVPSIVLGFLVLVFHILCWWRYR